MKIIKHSPCPSVPGDSIGSSELFKPASGLQGGGGGKGFSKARESGAIGREFKLDFVLPRRYKNLKRGGKRGQTSSILPELPEFLLSFSALFLSFPFPTRFTRFVKKDLLKGGIF